MQEFLEKKSKKNFTAILINLSDEKNSENKILTQPHCKLANISIIEHLTNNIINAGARNIISILPSESQSKTQYVTKHIHRYVDKDVNIENLFLKNTTSVNEFYHSWLEKKNLHTTQILIFYSMMPMLQSQSIQDIVAKIKNSPVLAKDCKEQIAIIAANPNQLKHKAAEKNIFDKNQLAEIITKNQQNHIIQIEEQQATLIESTQKLAECENIIQNQLRQKFLEQGISITLPQTVFFSADTQIKDQTHIEPYVIFGKNVKIGQNCLIKSFSYLEETSIGDNSTIGPYARMRANTKTGNNVKIGNFVETKNSFLDDNVKASHLAYLGDALVGTGTNIGAGAITCNYDGKNKHKTIIKEKVFIGSNSSLIAPVEIEKQSFIAAGSVITKNVPKNTLAIARPKTITKIIKNEKK